MNHFSIIKTIVPVSADKKYSLVGGYIFKSKIIITLYNRELIEYILVTKINSSLKKIINLYLAYEQSCDDDDSQSLGVIIPKIENMRSMLFSKYAQYLDIKVVEGYIDKLDKLESKIYSKKRKKNRSL